MIVHSGLSALLRDIALCCFSSNVGIRTNARSALCAFCPKAIDLVPKKDLTLALLLVTFLNVIDAINLIIAFAVILTSVACTLCLIGSTYRNMLDLEVRSVTRALNHYLDTIVYRSQITDCNGHIAADDLVIAAGRRLDIAIRDLRSAERCEYNTERRIIFGIPLEEPDDIPF